MKSFVRPLSYIVAAALMAAAIWLTSLGVLAFRDASATARLGVITAAVSVATFIYNNSRQQTREIRARQFADKRTAYHGFFNFLFEVLGAQKSGAEIQQDGLVERMHSIVKDLMVWGSADTINQYNSFMRSSSTDDGSDLSSTFKNVEDLLRAFRKDLGHNDKRLESFGLSKLILKADEHYRLDQPSPQTLTA